MNWTSFHRARRFGSPPLGTRAAVYASSIAAALLIVLLILLLGAITELVTSRGNLSVDLKAKNEIEQLAGSSNRIAGDQMQYVARGLLPAVWRLHDTWLGAAGDWLFASWPALGRNESCLPAIVVTGWCLSLLLAAALYALERSARISARDAVRRLRRALFQQSVQLGAGDLLLGQKHNVVNLFVERVEVFARGLLLWTRATPQAVLLLALLFVSAAFIDFGLALASVLLAAVSWMMLGGLRNKSNRRAAIWADAAAQRCDALVEELQQVRSLGNFAPTSAMPGGSFEERLRNCHIASVKQHTSPSLNESAVLFFVLCGAWLILFLGGLNVLADPPRLLFSATVMLAASVISMLYPLRLLQRLGRALPEAEQAATDIVGYLDRQPGVGQVPEAKPLVPPMKAISLANVRLADSRGVKLFDDVSFAIRCRSRTAIIASDKETPFALAGLLARLYDPAAGRILFDGQNIDTATLSSLRSQVGIIVPGQTLVTGSVTENIACGDGRFSAREIIDAARQSLAYDFVQRLPHGFDTVVGEHGLHLSSVEAMLIGIARIMAQNPAIAVIGELSDRFDAGTEDTLATAMNRVAEGRTLVVLARRLPTLRWVERILLFHEGQLVGDGSHAELLAESELYRHLNYVRFNEFRDRVSGQW